MNGPQIVTLGSGPLFDLIVAINQYVSTGDHVGEGMVMADAEAHDYWVLIPVHKHHAGDKADFVKLMARLAECGTLVRWDKAEGDETFEGWAMILRDTDAGRLTGELLERPGPLGWGSCHPRMSGMLRELVARREGETE